MSWFQIDEFTSRTGGFILRGVIVTGGFYLFQLVDEPVNVYRRWAIVVPSDFPPTGVFPNARMSIEPFVCTTALFRRTINTAPELGTRRLAYYFPQFDRLGARTVRVFHWQP